MLQRRINVMGESIQKDHRLRRTFDPRGGHSWDVIRIIKRSAYTLVTGRCDRHSVSAEVATDITIPIGPTRHAATEWSRPLTSAGAPSQRIVKQRVSIENSTAGS